MGKCAVYGCKNYSHQGWFHGEACMPCWEMLTTGKIGPSDNFIAKLDCDLKNARTKISTMDKVITVFLEGGA